MFIRALTALELVAGILLVLGLAPRVGTLLALAPVVFLTLVHLSYDRWLPEHRARRLVVLAIFPTGYASGLDVRLNRSLRRWPL